MSKLTVIFENLLGGVRAVQCLYYFTEQYGFEYINININELGNICICDGRVVTFNKIKLDWFEAYMLAYLKLAILPLVTFYHSSGGGAC